jgi:hypothetical protein
MIEATQEEAFLILEKWRAEKTELLCSFRGAGWELLARVTVSSLSRDKASLSSRDGRSALLTLRPAEVGLVFGFSGSGEYGQLEDGRGGLTVVLPLRFRPLEGSIPVPERDKLLFVEISSPTQA